MAAVGAAQITRTAPWAALQIESTRFSDASKLGRGRCFAGPVARSTFADASERRDWRMWEDLARGLIAKARTLDAGEDLGIDLENTVYALDSTTIDLSLTLFPWADFRKTKAGVKMHTQLDLRGPFPTCIHVTNARQHDVLWLD